MARKYRKIDPRIWSDERFSLLPDTEKVVALYVLTCPQSNRVGIFRFSLALASEDLGVTPIRIAERFAKVCDTFRWKWDASAKVVYLPTWWKYNQPENPKHLIGCLEDLADLPATKLAAEFAENTAYLSPNLSDTYRIRMQTLKRYQEQEQEQEQKQEQKQEQELTLKGSQSADADSLAVGKPLGSVAEVYGQYLLHHPRAAKTLASTSKDAKLIKARLAEGFTVQDLQSAIDGNHLSPFHCGKNDHSRQYHNLDLIFRDQSRVTDFIEYANGKRDRNSDPRGTFTAAEEYLGMFKEDDNEQST